MIEEINEISKDIENKKQQLVASYQAAGYREEEATALIDSNNKKFLEYLDHLKTMASHGHENYYQKLRFIADYAQSLKNSLPYSK